MGIFNKNYSLSDLENIKDQLRIKRSDYKIIVIEDKVFDYIEELRRHDFNIVLYDDIRNLSIISEFDIIVSDIKGVGKYLGSKLEGAHLIQEIHKRYPNKYLISYSVSRFDPTYNSYFSLCDLSLKKGIDLNEWVNIFDQAIDRINDPIYQWDKTRKILIDNKVSLDTVSKLEKVYIKSVVKKKPEIFTKETKKISLKSETSKIVFESISYFAATLISKFIKPD